MKYAGLQVGYLVAGMLYLNISLKLTVTLCVDNCFNRGAFSPPSRTFLIASKR